MWQGWTIFLQEVFLLHQWPSNQSQPSFFFSFFPLQTHPTMSRAFCCRAFLLPAGSVPSIVCLSEVLKWCARGSYTNLMAEPNTSSVCGRQVRVHVFEIQVAKKKRRKKVTLWVLRCPEMCDSLGTIAWELPWGFCEREREDVAYKLVVFMNFCVVFLGGGVGLLHDKVILHTKQSVQSVLCFNLLWPDMPLLFFDVNFRL